LSSLEKKGSARLPISDADCRQAWAPFGVFLQDGMATVLEPLAEFWITQRQYAGSLG